MPELRPTRGYVVISLDALRADRLGLYGADRPTSSFLDWLADRALRPATARPPRGRRRRAR